MQLSPVSSQWLSGARAVDHWPALVSGQSVSQCAVYYDSVLADCSVTDVCLSVCLPVCVCVFAPVYCSCSVLVSSIDSGLVGTVSPCWSAHCADESTRRVIHVQWISVQLPFFSSFNYQSASAWDMTMLCSVVLFCLNQKILLSLFFCRGSALVAMCLSLSKQSNSKKLYMSRFSCWLNFGSDLVIWNILPGIDIVKFTSLSTLHNVKVLYDF